MSKVILYDCPTYDAVAPLVERALDQFAPPLAGRRVLIKPNILGPCAPEEHVTTHPSLVAATVAACRRRGAAEINVGDNPGMVSYGSCEQAARASGIFDAAGGCYRNIADAPVALRDVTPHLAEVPVSRAVLEADVIINLPKMKTHVATGLTGAVKNTFGYVVGAAKTQLHATCRGPREFAGAVLDVFAIRPPDVSIMDAVYAMEGQGPSGGRPRFVGRLIAASDAVALDTVVAHLMGLKIEQVPYLERARARGLGETHLERIEIVGSAVPLAHFRRPRFGLAVGTWIASRLSRIFVTLPRADPRTCVRCGACAKQCPVAAIVMDDLPVIASSRCISCFCCHEFCRFKAMRLAPRVRLIQALRGGGR